MAEKTEPWHESELIWVNGQPLIYQTARPHPHYIEEVILPGGFVGGLDKERTINRRVSIANFYKQVMAKGLEYKMPTKVRKQP